MDDFNTVYALLVLVMLFILGNYIQSYSLTLVKI